MWLLLLPLLAQQVPAERSVLEAEHARAAGVSALVRATASGNPRIQALAARGLGRTENVAHRDALLPLLSAASPAVRAAAASALAQLRAPFSYASAIGVERNAGVRANLFEAIGRASPATDDAELALVRGLRDAVLEARVGAARGLEAFLRLNRRERRAMPGTLTALHAAFTADRDPSLRTLILLAMSATRDADATTLETALTDASPQVRRLGVIGLQRFVVDTSAIVRVDAYRYSASCAELATALRDPSDQVVLAVIGYVKERACPSGPLADMVSLGRNGEQRGTALLALATVDSARARAALPALARDTSWQFRAAVAQAAVMLKETAPLQLLARDPNPNVAAAGVIAGPDLLAALRSDHAGLLLTAATRLAGAPELATQLGRVVGAFNRLTADGSMTMRDARVALLTRIGEVSDTTTNGLLRDALHDRDPAIAALAATILSSRTGSVATPATTTLPIPPIPPASVIAGLVGAQARITMKDLGTMTLDLLTDEAPVTVAVFAQLAESGQYNGLTFHRIVPNFVLQGGSPGADEYDGRTREFMRDELGTARNARGTIGISTRGRDTGDGQIYFNVIDNVRLDRDYTVMATMRRGLDVMDRIVSGSVIERIEIIRATRPVTRTR